MLRKENEGWWNLHAAATGEREGRVIGLGQQNCQSLGYVEWSLCEYKARSLKT